VEIKCPYSARSVTALDAPGVMEARKQPFCSKINDNGNLALSETHKYYFQVMGQMAITGMKWVDFVIWTKHGDPSVERIAFDKSMWDSMVPKLHRFYVQGMVAEFFSKRVQRGIPLYV